VGGPRRGDPRRQQRDHGRERAEKGPPTRGLVDRRIQQDAQQLHRQQHGGRVPAYGGEPADGRLRKHARRGYRRQWAPARCGYWAKMSAMAASILAPRSVGEALRLARPTATPVHTRRFWRASTRSTLSVPSV